MVCWSELLFVCRCHDIMNFLQSCGLKRDSDGKVIMNTTSKRYIVAGSRICCLLRNLCCNRPQFVCSQTCDRPPTPEPRTAMLMPGTGNQEIRLNSSDGKVCFTCERLHALGLTDTFFLSWDCRWLSRCMQAHKTPSEEPTTNPMPSTSPLLLSPHQLCKRDHSLNISKPERSSATLSPSSLQLT